MKTELLYRDGGNYKTFVTLEVPQELIKTIKKGDEYEIEQFGKSENWLHEQTGNKYDPDLDHNLVEVVEIIHEERAWSFVEKYYPDYSSCDEIALNNDLSKLNDKEYEIGDCAHQLLIEKYDKNIENPQIQIDLDQSNAYVFETAIIAYLETLK